MMTWSQKRQLSIALSLLTLVVIFTAIFFGKRHIEKPQTCFDGIKNQNEKQTDCGIVCHNICKEDEKKLTLLWTRILPARDAYWNFAFSLENTNNIMTQEMRYHARIFDESATLIKEIDGKLPILPKQTNVWIHPIPFETGKRIPSYAQVSFDKALWLYPTSEQELIHLFVRDTKIITKQNRSSISGILENKSPFVVNFVTLTCLALSKKDSVLYAQKTQENELLPYENRKVACVWPQELDQETISRVEIIPNFDLMQYKKL
jgi:hypothetical protein